MLIVNVVFSHALGNLDAALLDPAGNTITTARSESDNEKLVINAATVSGNFIIGVVGVNGATNTYDLHLSKNSR